MRSAFPFANGQIQHAAKSQNDVSTGSRASGLEERNVTRRRPRGDPAEALAALVANRPAHLSGRLNRVIYRLVPAAVTTRLARSMVRQGMGAVARG
jgi:hypothetical protein